MVAEFVGSVVETVFAELFWKLSEVAARARLSALSKMFARVAFPRSLPTP